MPSSRATDLPQPDSADLPRYRFARLGALIERTTTGLRWLGDVAWRLLRRLCLRGPQRSQEWLAWYNELYRSLGERAMQSGRPGECLPDLVVHDIQGTPRQLSRCWEKQPALLVTVSLSCGRTQRHSRALRRLARRFEKQVNTVIIYVVEAHPINAHSPYTEGIWLTPQNEVAGLHRAQPQTLEGRIELAKQLRRRFRLSTAILIDALDDRVWRTFGGAPNVAILVNPDGRIAAKQGWFEPDEMARAITALLQNTSTATDGQTSYNT